MATFVQKLAAWAASASHDKMPKAILERARLQHLHLATLVGDRPADGPWVGLKRLYPRGGTALLAGGGKCTAVGAARIHTTQAAWTDRLDHILGGSPGVGAVTASWAYANGAQFSDLLAATVAANEVGGRIGAAILLGPHHGMGAGWVHAASAATAAGRLLGLSEDKLAHAIALALASSGAIPRSIIAGEGRPMGVAAAVTAGLGAASAARSGVRGPLEILEVPGGLLENGCWIPLHHAFTGLGEAWLTETLSIPRWPGPPVWHAVLDGVDEVLARHIKAADRRLRPDQVQAIKVAVPAPAVALDNWMGRHGLRSPISLGHAIRHGIGALVVEHEFGSAELSDLGWAERRERYGEIASRVTVSHSLDLSLEIISNMVSTAAPLIGGINEIEWRSLIQHVEGSEVGWRGVSLGGIRGVFKHRPDKWLKALKHSSGDLSEARLNEWQPRMGADILLETIRGGQWPESRVTALGGPGTSWGELVEDVLRRFSGEEPARLAAARLLWEAPADQDATVTVERLLH
jgi:2-methylcitrate dehydratase PrpD